MSHCLSLSSSQPVWGRSGILGESMGSRARLSGTITSLDVSAVVCLLPVYWRISCRVCRRIVPGTLLVPELLAASIVDDDDDQIGDISFFPEFPAQAVVCPGGQHQTWAQRQLN